MHVCFCTIKFIYFFNLFILQICTHFFPGNENLTEINESVFNYAY